MAGCKQRTKTHPTRNRALGLLRAEVEELIEFVTAASDGRGKCLRARAASSEDGRPPAHRVVLTMGAQD